MSKEEELSARIEELEEEIKGLRKELDNARHESSSNEARAEDLGRALQDLIDAVESATGDLTDVKAAFDNAAREASRAF